MNKIGIIIILCGIGLFFISIFISNGYDQSKNVINNMYQMKIVIKEAEEKFIMGNSKSKNVIDQIKQMKYEHVNEFSIPLPLLLSVSIITILIGIGKITLSKK